MYSVLRERVRPSLSVCKCVFALNTRINKFNIHKTFMPFHLFPLVAYDGVGGGVQIDAKKY